MDLLATVRKEGSRGGQGDFKWTDVQNSSHRENYLGHSVMAPVGRWQKGRDLNWYAKGEQSAEAEEKAAMERKEELRRIKEAEQDAMARALGLPVPDRTNANLQEVSNKREFDKVLKEAVNDGEDEGGKGVGFKGGVTDNKHSNVFQERIEGNAEAQDKELQYALREYRRRHDDPEPRRRSRSRDRERTHRRRDQSRERRDHRRSDHTSGTKERHRRRRSRSKSRSRERRHRDRRRDRSRSPARRERDDDRSRHRRRHD